MPAVVEETSVPPQTTSWGPAGSIKNCQPTHEAPTSLSIPKFPCYDGNLFNQILCTLNMFAQMPTRFVRARRY